MPALLAGLLLSGAGSQALLAAGREPDLAACRDILDDAERLACYDGLAARPGASRPPTTTPEALFGMEPHAAAALLQLQQGDEPLETIEQTVATVTTDRNGRLRLALANGQQWVQVDSDRLRLAPGDAVRIRRAALGSHLLSREAGGRAIRVRRVDAPPPHPTDTRTFD